MKEMELYKIWSEQTLEDKDLNEELAAIAGDVDAISDRFIRRWSSEPADFAA